MASGLGAPPAWLSGGSWAHPIGTDKLGLTFDTVKTGRFADALTVTRQDLETFLADASEAFPHARLAAGDVQASLILDDGADHERAEYVDVVAAPRDTRPTTDTPATFRGLDRTPR